MRGGMQKGKCWAEGKRNYEKREKRKIMINGEIM